MFKRTMAVLVCSASLFGCEGLTSPNFNSGDLEELENNPTAASLVTAVQGLLIGIRSYNIDDNDLVSMLGILGRESYNNDVADPRFEAEMLGGDQLQASSPAFGGNLWSRPYQNIKQADIVLTGLDQLDEGEMSQSDAEWIRGFAKTMQALDFLTVVNTRDTNCGCPIEVPARGEPPAPTVGRQAVFDHIVSLLEEAQGHLQNTTGPAPIRFSSGFTPTTAGTDLSTREGFLSFNRALRARVGVYMGAIFDDQAQFTAALQALSGSFLDPAADLRMGAYHAFSAQSGDETNLLFLPSASPNVRAHPSIKDDVQLQGDGTPDERFDRKIRPIDNSPYQGICLGVSADAPNWPPDPRYKENATQECDVGFAIYNSTSAPVPIIKNEELILLRAEANLGVGNLTAAMADINLIRERSGGLPPVNLTTAPEILDELLYNKRMSLLFEGGHRWLDMRHYDRLGELPLDKPAHRVHAVFPIPSDEQLARDNP